MKKSSKAKPTNPLQFLKAAKKNKDSMSLMVATLSFVVIIVVLCLSYFSRTSKMPQVGNQIAEDMQSGVQTATIVVKPANASSSEGLVNNVNLEEEHMMMMNSEGKGAFYAGDRVKYKIDRFQKLALQPLEFEVLGADKQPLTPDNLNVVHEYAMHYLVVSANMKEYQHLHPTYNKVKKKWTVLANLPNVGTYYAYIDVAPKDGSPLVYRTDLIVREATGSTVSYPETTPDFTVKSKDYTATLTTNNLSLHQQAVLSFHVTRLGKDATNLQPYLGALGHVVAFRHGDADSFMHVHPLSSSDASKGLVEFTSIFTQAGRYTVFAQFKLGKQVYTFPVTFEVKS